MLTREQAMTTDVFHYEPNCTLRKTERWYRNGSTQTWKTRPDEYRIPVKFGLYDYGQIWHWKASEYHAQQDCPNGHS